MTMRRRHKNPKLKLPWAIGLSLAIAFGGAGLCSALMMRAIPTFGWFGWIVSMVYAGGIAGVIILSRISGKTLSIWDPAILALTAGIFLLRVVEGTHEHVVTRQKQRANAVAELTACEQSVRKARQTKADNYRGVAPTARGREWDAEEKKGLQDCRERTPVPAAPQGNGMAELTLLDWFVLLGPCVIDFALIGLVKRFGAAAIDVALRSREEDELDVHPAFRGVNLAKLPPEIVADLDIMAGTYKGELLGRPQWRRVDGGRVMWPVLHGLTTPSGGVAFVGGQRFTETVQPKALLPPPKLGKGEQPKAQRAASPRQALGRSFQPPDPNRPSGIPQALIPRNQDFEVDRNGARPNTPVWPDDNPNPRS